MPSRLLIFAKYPRAGQVKTRLTPAIEPAAAAALYRAFLLDALEHYVALRPAIEPVLLVARAEDAQAMRELAAGEGMAVEVRAQRGEGLGDRLEHAFADAFDAGSTAACAIGTDHPTLPVARVVEAFEAVTDPAGCDVAIGPADDGGYYLLALADRRPRLLRDMPYSSPELFGAVMAAAEADGLGVRQLEPWYDVDDEASLLRLWSERNLLAPGSRTRAQLGSLQHAIEMLMANPSHEIEPRR